MYKTVRKGDASLQYTILPQTDQFSSSGFPQASSKSRPRIIKFTMGTLMILILLSYVATPFLMNQNDQSDQSLFVSAVLSMGRVAHNTVPRNSSRSQGEDVVANKSRSKLPETMTTASSTEARRKQDTEEGTTSTSGKDFLLKAEDQGTEDLTTIDSGVSSTQRFQASSEASTSLRQTTPVMQPSTLPSTSSTTPKTSASTWTEVATTPSSAPKKVKMPRVTLKLRENETIPQMYMKAGIASYKKGNITTSVLAHGLSLEGLIFKTPEGTIKPWPQKWFFTDPSSDFQWKGSNQMPVAMYIVLAGLAALVSVGIVLMLYVQRKVTRRQRQSVEEPEVGGQEEDKSTLLGGESQETEEKE